MKQDEDLRDLDRELSQLAAVQPSPEFAAKVRARIQQQPVSAFAWPRWTMASVAVAATIAIAIVIVATVRKPPVPVLGDAGLRAGRVATDVHLPYQVHPAPHEQIPTPVPDRVGRARQVVRSERPVEPEVLIDPAVGRAVRRLAMERPLLPEVPPEPSLAPVVVEPLRMPDISEIASVRLGPDLNR